MVVKKTKRNNKTNSKCNKTRKNSVKIQGGGKPKHVKVITNVVKNQLYKNLKKASRQNMTNIQKKAKEFHTNPKTKNTYDTYKRIKNYLYKEQKNVLSKKEAKNLAISLFHNKNFLNTLSFSSSVKR